MTLKQHWLVKKCVYREGSNVIITSHDNHRPISVPVVSSVLFSACPAMSSYLSLCLLILSWLISAHFMSSFAFHTFQPMALIHFSSLFTPLLFNQSVWWPSKVFPWLLLLLWRQRQVPPLLRRWVARFTVGSLSVCHPYYVSHTLFNPSLCLCMSRCLCFIHSHLPFMSLCFSLSPWIYMEGACRRAVESWHSFRLWGVSVGQAC